MSVSYEAMLELSAKEPSSMFLMWREMIQSEIEEELRTNRSLTQEQFDNTAKRAALHIEQYGCSVQKAVERILNPGDFIGMKEHA
jgi:hypothetical protein